MRRWLPYLLLVAALALYLPLCQGVWASRAQSRAETPAGYMIPSKFSRILALGNHGLLSDYQFLKVATYIGGKGLAQQEMGEADWHFVKSGLEVVTDLDPYFVDPYILAEGILAWDAGQPQAANELLAKGAKYRTSDWRLPFYIGFNHFYFLKDYETAADYIITAAQLPGSPAYLQPLAARLAYYGGKSKTAVLFLQEMIAETNDPLLKKHLTKRLMALESAVVIEEAVEKFKAQEGRMPDPLSELIAAGYLAVFPVDPYGGTWGLMKNGRVYSSSRFTETPPVKAPKKK